MDIEEAKEQLLKHKKEIDAKFISARYSKAIEVVLSELDKKDKIKDKIYDFCRRELAFEKRLKREKRKPDEFNQGRFYVCENIKEILTNKVEESEK